MTTSAFKIEIIEDIQGLHSIERKWKDFFVTALGRSPFNSYEWVSAWLDAYGTNLKLFICVISDNSGIAAIVPMIKKRYLCFDIFEFICSERSDYLDFMIRDESLLPVIFHVFADHKNSWDLISLKNLGWSRARRLLSEKAIEDLGLTYVKRLYTRSPYLGLSGSWDDYLASRGKRFRKKIKKKERRLLSKANIEIKKILGLESSDPRIGNIFQTAKAIEKQSWKYMEGNPRIQTDKKSEKFYQNFISSFVKNGWLESWFLLLDDLPIAYAFNIRFDGKIFAYNSAYFESKKEYGPGALLHIHRIRDAFEQNLKEYDFLRGTESYKLEWTNDLRDIYEYALFNSRFKSRFLARFFIETRWKLSQNQTIKRLRYRGITLLNKLRRMWEP